MGEFETTTTGDRQDTPCEHCPHAYAFHGGVGGPCGQCDCESFEQARSDRLRRVVGAPVRWDQSP